MGYTQVLKEINGELFENCGEIMVTRHHDNYAFVCYRCEQQNIFMDLGAFANHMQSQHVSMMETTYLGDDNDDDIEVDDFQLHMKGTGEEAEYIDDDFDVQLTEEYIESDYDYKPEVVETVPAAADDLIEANFEASISTPTAGMDNELESRLFDVEFDESDVPVPMPVPNINIKKPSFVDSKKAAGRQVQKLPVLIAPKPPTKTAAFSSVVDINASANNQRTLVTDPQTLLAIQSITTKRQQQQPKVLESNAAAGSSDEMHSTYYDLQFIDTGIMPQQLEMDVPTVSRKPRMTPKLAAPQEVSQKETQQHTVKVEMPQRTAQQYVVVHTAIGQQKIFRPNPQNAPNVLVKPMLSSNIMMPKGTVQVAGQPVGRLFQQVSASHSQRPECPMNNSSDFIDVVNPTMSSKVIEIDDDDDDDNRMYDKLLSEVQATKASPPMQRIIHKRRMIDVPELEPRPLTKIQQQDLEEFIAMNPKPAKTVVRRQACVKREPPKRPKVEPTPIIPDSKTGLDAHFKPLTPMKRNIIITKRIALPNQQRRRTLVKPATTVRQPINDPKRTKRQTRGRPRLSAPVVGRSVVSNDDHRDDSTIEVSNTNKSDKVQVRKGFVTVPMRLPVKKEEAIRFESEEDKTLESRRSSRAIKKVVKFNH